MGSRRPYAGDPLTIFCVERLGPRAYGHYEFNILGDLLHHGTMVMVPQTSLLSLEAWLPRIIVWAFALAVGLGST
jgi:hypothetical protein